MRTFAQMGAFDSANASRITCRHASLAMPCRRCDVTIPTINSRVPRHVNDPDEVVPGEHAPMEASVGYGILEIGEGQPAGQRVDRRGCERLSAQRNEAHCFGHGGPASKSARYGSNTNRRFRA